MTEQGTPNTRDRLSMDSAVSVAAYVAALDVASEVQLAAVLQRLVDLARAVVPSRYAALGVSDDNGHITEFITSGISTLERARIGPIPEGHGMLGALIHDRTPLLIERITDDARSVGFPEHHPPMESLLGVPILLGDRVLGDLYLTERLEDRAYDAADLEAVQILAAHAASAIDRAQLFSKVELNRRRAEDERDQLQVILDSFPTGVIIQRAPDGVVELVNATALAMTGSPSEWTVDNRHLHYRMLRQNGRTLPEPQWPGMRALGGEVVRNRQLLLANTNGGAVPVLVQAVPLRNRRGDVERAVVVMQDITRLREAEQLKDDFLSLVSHEFRTPLTAIHGGALLLAQQGDDLDRETRKGLVNDIVDESARLEQMLANILTLTALQAGRIDPLNEPILVSAIVREASAIAHKKSPDHAFVNEIPTSLPLAEGDRDLLVQVLSNLYENAVKYSQPGTTVTTSASASGKDVSISILDQGSGIAPEHLGTVFERFRRPGADPSVRGMGLGLYLSRHLIEAQGGQIDVASAGIDAGSTFRITLPISSDWSDVDEQSP